MSPEHRPPFPQDDFWTHDHQIGEAVFYRQPHTIRLKLHQAAERFDQVGDPEIIPLKHRRGERLYFLAKPYILVPDITVRINLYPHPTASDQGAIGEVADSSWEGMKHEEIGSSQAWYYPEDQTLVLWEVDLHRHHRQPNPVGDPVLTAVWQGFERVLVEHCPGAKVLATPFDDPNYEREEYQAFLRSQGYEPIAQAAFGKEVTRRS
jgi:hypothetical protein